MTPNNKRQEQYNTLMTECHTMWAFGNKQFDEGLKKLRDNGILLEGEKLTDIGAGGYMPTKFVQKYKDGRKAIEVEFKKAMQDEKARVAHIVYTLWNHERVLEDTMDALGSDFTYEEIMKVVKSKRINIH